LAAAILISGAASAADLGRPAPAPVYTKAPIAPQPLWTGFYAGVEGGYGWSSDPTVSFSNNDPAAARLFTLNPIPAISFPDRGAFGGVTAGYNWQIGRNWLVGLEADFSWSDIKGSGSNSILVFGSGEPLGTNVNQKLDWFGTVRPRIGWLASDNLLLYGTGGLAYGRIEESTNTANTGPLDLGPAFFSGFVISCPAHSTCYAGYSTKDMMGWSAGAGTEYRVPGTAASLKLEYLFVDLGPGPTLNSVNTFIVPPGVPSSVSGSVSRSEFHTVKAGLNWHF